MSTNLMQPGKLALLAFIIILIAGFFIFDLQDQVTLENLKTQQKRFQTLNTDNPVLTKSVFFLAYVAVAALSLPGALIMTLAAGAFFGVISGSIIVSFASTIGATLAMLAARYLFRDVLQNKYANRLKTVNRGIREEGGFYLFTLRLIPVIPFFIVNLVMGLTKIKTSVFALVSQLGMLPATVIYVNAGHQLAAIDSVNDILSLPIILSLAVLGLFPLLTKKLINAYRRSHADSP